MIAFLYPGQGSQQEKMGLDLYEKFPEVKEYYDALAGELDGKADGEPDMDFLNLAFEGDMATVSATSNTQPLMVAFQNAVTMLLKEKGIFPDYAAGLSLGEYSALCAAGVLDKLDAVKIVRKRGLAMEKSSEGVDTKMSAIIGAEEELVSAVCEAVNAGFASGACESADAGQQEGKVYMANLNCPGQIVISGQRDAVNKAEELLAEKGVKRAIELKVSGPFHTPYMSHASEELKKIFEDVEFGNQELSVVFNLTGGVLEDGEIKEAMIKQVVSPVLFEKSLRFMLEAGVDTFVEIGCGKSIAGFLRKIDKNAKVYEINDESTLNKFLEERDA